MYVQDVYYVSRRLRWWLESEITMEFDRSIPMYLWIVVRDVVESPGSSIQEIAHRVGMVQSMVSKAIAQSEKRNWVRREVDVRDRRRTLIYPTDFLMHRMGPRLEKTLDEVLDTLFGDELSAEDRTHLHRGMSLLYSRFKSMEGEEWE